MNVFSQWVMLFIIYSFLGWIVEVLYCLILSCRFVNRGFLRTPVCPIYGAGVLIVNMVVELHEGHILASIIIAGGIISCLEYVCGWFLEKILNVKCWDYTGRFANLHGRICLMNGIVFALAGVFVAMFVDPVLNNVINGFNTDIVVIIDALVVTVFIIDFFHKASSLYILRKKACVIQMT